MTRYSLLFLVVFLSGCAQENNSFVSEKQLPKELGECSGIIFDNRTQLFWAINDSGNENEIFGIDVDGVLKKSFTIGGATNVDWEDITSDPEGNLYIGDFGNNDNDRKDLAIYKISASNLSQASGKITFNYPQQTAFPPAKKQLLYDCEAFFIYQNSFYLFTKNRSKEFDGTSLIYKVPMSPGHHAAQLVGQFKTCDKSRSCMVTAAAISPDEKKVVILSSDKVWMFENFQGDDFTSGTVSQIELNHSSQKEAISFKDNNTLFIADEKSKKTGGMLYELANSTLKNTN